MGSGMEKGLQDLIDPFGTHLYNPQELQGGERHTPTSCSQSQTLCPVKKKLTSLFIMPLPVFGESVSISEMVRHLLAKQLANLKGPTVYACLCTERFTAASSKIEWKHL